MNKTERTTLMTSIARPSGGFAMVALDGRESMRRIFRDAQLPHEDDDLADFKATVARTLGPKASAVLCDTVTGGRAIEVVRDELVGTGLIVAVDAFDEPRYGPLMGSSLDAIGMAPAVALGGVSALKLYLYWRPEDSPESRSAQSKAFVDGCHELGVLALLEGVITVAADDPTFDDALVRAAEEFGAFEPDVYKTQVPSLGQKSFDEIEAVSARLTGAVGVPWVALSNGVASASFPDAIGAVCRGGASGFLAGRGVWRAAVESADPVGELERSGLSRLDELVAVVDKYARPWNA